MSQSAASSAPAGSPVSTTPDTRLRGRWLLVARVGWIVVVILALALFVGGLPTFYALIQPPCMTAAACNLFGSLSPEQFRAMQSTGFSAHDIATFYFSLSIALVVIWAAVGLLIFWRRSDDWLALLVALALVLFNVGQQSGPPTALALASPAWTLPVEVLSFLSQASFGVFLFLFPNGRFAPRWARWFALVFLIQAALAVFPPANSPLGETNVPPSMGFCLRAPLLRGSIRKSTATGASLALYNASRSNGPSSGSLSHSC